MSPKLKGALKAAIVSTAFRKVLVAAIVAGGTYAGLTLEPQLADALGNVVIAIASAL